MDCIFCKIVNRELSSKIVYEDETIFAFHDISPEAPVHILVVPKKHIANLLETAPEDAKILTDILTTSIPRIVKEQGLEEKGFRLVVNTKEDGGQTVGHLHFHILGGRPLQWPPG